MHVTTLLLVTLGASSVLASDGVVYPHRRANLRSKGSVNTKAGVQKRASSENPSYLSSKSERENPNPPAGSNSYMQLMLTRE